MATLTGIWDRIQENEDVYETPLLGEKWGVIAALFTERGIARDGIYNPRPLAGLISDHVKWSRLEQAGREGRFWAIGVTSLTDGHPYLISNTDPLLQAGLKKYQGRLRLHLTSGEYGSIPDRVEEFVLASASIPLLFPPVDIYEHRFVDGGVRDVTPLSAVFLAAKAGMCPIEQIVVVNASPKDPPYRTKAELDSGREIVKRAIDLMVNEIMLNDLEVGKNLNRLAGGGTVLQIPVMEVWPDRDFGLGSLEFSNMTRRRQLREHGLEKGNALVTQL